jgi:hypothetical protein
MMHALFEGRDRFSDSPSHPCDRCLLLMKMAPGAKPCRQNSTEIAAIPDGYPP